MKALSLLVVAALALSWTSSARAEHEIVQERIAQKNAWRTHVMTHSKSGKRGMGVLSEISGNDIPEDLVDQPEGLRRTLEQMESQGLRSGALSANPWSDDYWAVYQGGLGARYADPGFPKSKDWGVNHRYVANRPAREIIRSGDPLKINLLAPSEKYDLLIGDTSGILTDNMWKIGEEYYSKYGSVEDWIGFCHGWAVAANMIARPKRAVTLKAADGKTPVKFYPADVKALTTLLWAQGTYSYRFIGGRCDVNKPSTDGSGRIKSQDCFDTNPAAWHLAVTHQVGALKRGLILDSVYDYEVWNQPIQSYTYGYFNPISGRTVSTINKAKIQLSQLRDIYRQYRSPKAVSIVGIAMNLTYMNENIPAHAETDGPQTDVTKTVTYYYDLELDAQGNIVGGEWYNKAHPDFLWVALPDSSAVSEGDSWISGKWNEGVPMPSTWFEGALHASRYTQPLAAIVNRLVEWSSN